MLSACVVAWLSFACGGLNGPAVAPAVPEISPVLCSISTVPDARRYAVEFAHPPESAPELAVADHPEPVLPFERSRIPGRILSARHDQVCSLWMIASYGGENWMEDQRFHLYFEKSAQLLEVTAVTDKGTLSEVFMLSGADCDRPLLLCEFTYRFNSSCNELWTYDLRGKHWKLISNGNSPELSPDRSKAKFWRSDDFAFHCLHVWDIQTGVIKPVLSLREPDPGSGTSWDSCWSQDSKAIHVVGDCSGFTQQGGDHRGFDLVYLVGAEKLVSFE